MASFRTEFNTRLHKNSIPLSSSVLTLGSCFADGIGNKLKANKFNVMINPFGTTYNPLSIHKLIQLAIHNQPPAPETFLSHDGIQHNYDFHSSFGAISKTDLEQNLVNTIGSVHFFLKNCNFLFLTYGTSWVYERNDSGEVVSNCHKQPAALFTKRLLTQKSIEDSFGEMHSELKKLVPGIRIILTLSPVRHVKDTLELNSVSKSLLRVACHSIKEQFADVDYFPAYEIMMDDLRDYRFYASDMIHPSVEAENYIWEKFMEMYFSSETKEILNEWQSIKKMMEHRPFFPESLSHQKFQQTLRVKLEALQSKLDVTEELKNIISLQES